jgi:hypothetical protein
MDIYSSTKVRVCILVPDYCSWGLKYIAFIDDIIKSLLYGNIHVSINMSQHSGMDSIKI